MDRKQFLRKLGLGALAVTVAPKVIGDIKEAPLKPKPSNLVVYPVADNIEIDGTFTINDYSCYTAEPDIRPRYLVGADPYVGDYANSSDKMYLVVAIYNGDITLRPLENGDDKNIRIEEFRRAWTIWGNCFMG